MLTAELSGAPRAIPISDRWRCLRQAVDGALTHTKESRFNLVDLAGSERQKDTNATGQRLKEANVINALVDRANGKPRHIHYRDSTLTFLLRVRGRGRPGLMSPPRAARRGTFS